MKTEMRNDKTTAHAGPNLCLKCWLYKDGKCRWEPGDYCKITRSR